MSSELKKRKSFQVKSKQKLNPKNSRSHSKKLISIQKYKIHLKEKPRTSVSLVSKAINSFEDIGTNTDFHPFSESFITQPRFVKKLKQFQNTSKHIILPVAKIQTPNVKSLTPIMFFPKFKTSSFKALTKHNITPLKKSVNSSKLLIDYSYLKKKLNIRRSLITDVRLANL